MRVALYPGSFDPITVGHVDIIQRLSKHFDKLIVLAANSARKKYLFNSEERVQLIEQIFEGQPSIEAHCFDGLTIDYAKKVGAKVIVRGIRAVSDFENEMAMATMNKSLSSDIETLVLFSSPEYHHVSSRFVKEIAMNGGPLKGLIPDNVITAMKNKF